MRGQSFEVAALFRKFCSGCAAFLLAGCAAFLLAGCASTMAKILPIGEPVTKERCVAFSMDEFGQRDGREARRPGEKFESWQQDCKAFGVRFDRAEYDRGYEKGLAQYCSCERGFDMGVRNQFTEIRGQYFMCQRTEYSHFLRGFDVGKKWTKDTELVKVVTPVKTEFNDAKINARAAAECAALPESQARKQEGRLHISLTVKATQKIAGPSVIASLVFKNNTDQNVRFVNWLVSQGGETANSYFRVSQDGRELPYQGMMAKRAAPTDKDFIVLKPGQELKDTADLSKTFAWKTGPGIYNLYFESSAHDPKTERQLRSEDASFSF